LVDSKAQVCWSGKGNVCRWVRYLLCTQYAGFGSPDSGREAGHGHASPSLKKEQGLGRSRRERRKKKARTEVISRAGAILHYPIQLPGARSTAELFSCAKKIDTLHWFPCSTGSYASILPFFGVAGELEGELEGSLGH
jgi:hypothetical protein